jgi:hypothetical protein
MAFPAEGDEDPLAVARFQRRPEAFKAGINPVLVEANLVGLPAFMPEIYVHIMCKPGKIPVNQPC